MFVTGRKQQVSLGSITSSTWEINTGGPQAHVLSPLLFPLDTNDCISGDPSVKILTFADDVVIGLVQVGIANLNRDGSLNMLNMLNTATQ